MWRRVTRTPAMQAGIFDQPLMPLHTESCPIGNSAFSRTRWRLQRTQSEAATGVAEGLDRARRGSVGFDTLIHLRAQRLLTSRKTPTVPARTIKSASAQVGSVGTFSISLHWQQPVSDTVVWVASVALHMRRYHFPGVQATSVVLVSMFVPALSTWIT